MTSLIDVLHLDSVVTSIQENVSLADLASFAVCSKGCAAALRPPILQLHVNRVNELQALRSLQRLSCLDDLKHATLVASEGDCTAGAYLGILGMCPRLQSVHIAFDLARRGNFTDQWHKQHLADFVEALPVHMARSVQLRDQHSHCVASFHWQPTEPAEMPTEYRTY